MIPGNVLLLLDGTYTEALNPPIGAVTIKAASDGGALIDGEGVRVPLTVTQNNVTIEGINASRSSGSVFAVSGDECTLRRCVGWDAGDDGNNHIFSVNTGTGVLLEDCAGFGIARKTFSITSHASYVAVRRCFGIWEGYTGTNGPTMTFTLGYKTYHCRWEYCIAMWDRHRIADAPDQPYGCFGVDNYTGEANDDAYNAAEQCVAMVRLGDTYDPNQGLIVSGIDYLTLNSMVIAIANAGPAKTASFDFGADRFHSNADGLTLIGPQPNTNVRSQNWILTNLLEALTVAAAYVEGETVWNTASGAQLDAAVFLAWPMRQRIIDAMTAAGYAAGNIIDVVDELTTVFGAA